MRFAIFAVAALTLLVIACSDNNDSAPTVTPAVTPIASSISQPPSTLSLTSSVFADNGVIPAKYTCDGDNVSPPLTIAGLPDETQALALTVVDIDGPGGNFVHYTAWNIDPSTAAVPQGALPAGGVEGLTGRGGPGFFGPCPPSGVHRYVFMLFALDQQLVLEAASSGLAELNAAMESHILASDELTGTYTR